MPCPRRQNASIIQGANPWLPQGTGRLLMKYDSLRKKDRNQLILKLRQDQPGLSLEEIASIFQITRQRVHQILHNPIEALIATQLTSGEGTE